MPQNPYQYIKLPDGSVGKFDATASDSDIKARIAKDFPNAYAQASQTPAQDAPKSLANRAWSSVWDPTVSAKALGVPAEQARLKALEQQDLAKLSAGYSHQPGTPWPAQTPDQAPGYLATLTSAGFQQRDIDPQTGLTHLLSPGNLAVTAGASLISGAGNIGKAGAAALSGYFAYRGEQAATKPQQPGESWYDYRARQVAGGAQALLGGLHAANYLGGEAREAIQPGPRPTPQPQLRPGAPPQAPMPATTTVPRTIDVEARVVDPDKPGPPTARPVAPVPPTPPEPQVGQPESFQQELAESLRLPYKPPPAGNPDLPMGAQATRLKPGEELPSPLGQSIKSAMPQRVAPTPETAQEAVELSSKPAPTTFYPHYLTDPLGRATWATRQLRDPALSDVDRAKFTNQLDKAKADIQTGFQQWVKGLGSSVGDAATWLRGTIPPIQEKADYLARHLDQRDQIAEFEENAFNLKQRGQEEGRLHAQRMPKGGRTPGGDMLVDSAGKPVVEPGAAFGTREVLGEVIGARRPEVANMTYARKVATALRAGKNIPTDEASPEVVELWNKYQDVKEGMRDKIAQGVTDLSGDDLALKAMEERLVLGATRSHGHPTKAQVAQAKGVAPETLETTGAGKAETIKHGGSLPVMTQAIWENDYSGPKGKGLPTVPQMQAKLEDLRADVKQRELFAGALEKRANERGSVGELPVKPQHDLDPERVLDRLKGRTDIEAYHVSAGRPTRDAAWLSPDGKIAIDPKRYTHPQAARLMTGLGTGHAEMLKGELGAYTPYKQAFREGWIRKADRGAYSVGTLNERALKVIENDLMSDHASLSKQRGAMIHLDSQNAVGKHDTFSIPYSDFVANEFDLAKSVIGEIRRAGMRGAAGDQPRSPESIIRATGLAYKGELMGGSGVHMFEHPEYPGLTSALDAKGVTDERAVLNKMAETLDTFRVRPSGLGRVPLAEDIEALRTQAQGIAGYSGSKLLAGISGGMVTGALAGGAIGGPVGAIVGTMVGAVAGSKVAAWLAPGSPLDAEIAELRTTMGESLESSNDALKKFINPISDDLRVSDAMFSWKGAIDKADTHAAQLMERYRRAGARLDKAAATQLYDAVKTGNWQGLSDAWKDWIHLVEEKEDSNYVQMQRVLQERSDLQGYEFQPTSFVDHHFRMLYANPERAPVAPKTLYGTRGMLKQHVYDTLSEAIANGLEPYTWNPIEMAALAWHDTHQFIYGMDLTKYMIQQARNGAPGAQFVPKDTKAPANYTRVAGKPLEVYFHVPEGMVKAGEWFVHKEYARMLNNALSPDYIRSNAVGRLALGFRAAYGQWRLFGPFHILAMNWAAAASEFGFGLREAQLGIRNNDLPELMKGLRDVATSVVAGRKDYVLGQTSRQADLAQLNPVGPNFWDSPTGLLYKKALPGAEELLEYAWKGGARNAFAVQKELRDIISSNFEQHFMQMIDSYAAQKKLAMAGHALAAAGTAPFAAMHLATGWLFETYIPALKLGVMLRDMDITFRENAHLLASGETTKIELARQVVRRTEDFMGQLNTDNFFLNNTFKTALMLSWRSFGWRFGTGEALWRGITENVGESKRIITAHKVGPDTYTTESRFPKLKPYSATWLGYAFLTAAASVAWYRLHHKNPQTLHDLIEPELEPGMLDERGKPARFGWPNYTGDVMRIAQNPFGLEGNTVAEYATGGIADMWSAVSEARQNKTWDGRFVVDPHERNEYYRFAYRVGHALLPFDTGGPGTFLTQNVNYWKQQGLSRTEAWGIGIGLGGRMPVRGADLSPAEKELQRLTSLHYGNAPMTDSAFNAVQAKHQIEMAVRNGRDYSDLMQQSLEKGILNKNDIKSAIRSGLQSYLVNGLRNPQVSLQDAMSVYQKANPAERQEILPYVTEKLKQLKTMRGTPDERDRLMNEYNSMVSQ